MWFNLVDDGKEPNCFRSRGKLNEYYRVYPRPPTLKPLASMPPGLPKVPPITDKTTWESDKPSLKVAAFLLEVATSEHRPPREWTSDQLAQYYRFYPKPPSVGAIARMPPGFTRIPSVNEETMWESGRKPPKKISLKAAAFLLEEAILKENGPPDVISDTFSMSSTSGLKKVPPATETKSQLGGRSLKEAALLLKEATSGPEPPPEWISERRSQYYRVYPRPPTLRPITRISPDSTRVSLVSSPDFTSVSPVSDETTSESDGESLKSAEFALLEETPPALSPPPELKSDRRSQCDRLYPRSSTFRPITISPDFSKVTSVSDEKTSGSNEKSSKSAGLLSKETRSEQTPSRELISDSIWYYRVYPRPPTLRPITRIPPGFTRVPTRIDEATWEWGELSLKEAGLLLKEATSGQSAVSSRTDDS